MKALISMFILLALLPIRIYSQNSYLLSGQVFDENQRPLPGVTVFIKDLQKGAISDKDGDFEFNKLPGGTYSIEFLFMGYENLNDTIKIPVVLKYHANMKLSAKTLAEVIVLDSYSEKQKKENPINAELANSNYIKSNLSGSLMKSLERFPGIGAIEIGSGQSKPVIRGLGFNRVVVLENGIKHEGQQWGAEHGLEIDQYAVDRVEIIKGPASLMYGSDAIGGIIDIEQLDIPSVNTFGGSIDLAGKSNNNLFGTSIGLFVRKKRLFFKGRYTFTDYADYKVPTDSVDIYSYRAPLYKNKLRNTAGGEQDLHFSSGFVGDKFTGHIYFSKIKSKAGFFANAHGLEPRRVDTNLHDKKSRDIQFPFQEVEHLKIVAKGEYRFTRHKLVANIGYQNNFRQEWSQYVAHGYMPPVFSEDKNFPKELELEFNKDIYSANIKDVINFSEKFVLTAGISSEYQNNRIGGRGFIIPAFTQYTRGAFTYAKVLLSAKTILHSGIRFDYGKIHIEGYQDWFLSPVISGNNDTTSTFYLERSPDLEREFNSFCWSLGLNYNAEKFNFKANVGRSFRMPIAKELAANGVNYHHFSYEIGNPNLDAEISYQLDLGMELNFTRFALGLSPFFNYFPNYIYLNPSYKHDYLYGAGNQIYYYTQSKVMRFGGEIHAHYDILKQLQAGLIGEYVYSEQLSGDKKGFTLPFSPPTSFIFNLKYKHKQAKLFSSPQISVDYKLALEQNKIVPPERKTPAYHAINISLGSELKLKSFSFYADFQIQNLFNSKYFNHSSYYRIINVPEPGRNFILNLSIPFKQYYGK